MRKLALFAVAVAFLALPALAQKKQLTLELVDDPAKRVMFSGAIQSGFQWLDDNSFIWPRRNEKGELVEWRRFDVKTKKEAAFFDRAKMEASLRAAGLPADIAKEVAGRSSFSFDSKKNSFLFTAADDLWIYSFAKGTATRLTSAAGKEEVPGFSPDGQKIAFVRDNNLFVVDLAGRERQLTTSGSKDILNGKLDWVYQEEVFGRGNYTGYWWSTDSAKLAFMQLDESPVHEYTVVDHIPYRQDLEVEDYPKPGDPNPRAKLFTVAALGGTPKEIDLEKYSAGEFLIVNGEWKDESTFTFQVQDREQTWLDLNTADAKGQVKTLFRDKTQAWIEPLANPVWLKDGTFLWQSERNGWRHLYHYAADGTAPRQVTTGEWEVRDVAGVDEKNGVIYFAGTERSHIAPDVYSIRLDGTGLKRLSATPGTHTATFNPSFTMYVDKWSDIRTPDQVRLHRADGSEVLVVDANPAAVLAEYDLPQPEFLQVKARDGFVMEAIMIKPSNFDASKKYPVYQHLYAGPHAPTVRNGWYGSTGMFLRLLAQQGVIVWMMDNRTASGKGAVSAWPVYKQFGVSELRDLEDGVTWLKAQPYVDGSRIMLNGWSYGGFMVSYALTHSKSFAAGIAGGSVTDWRSYDSIYTERYMLMPQNNPEGYRNSSPRFAAKDLHGNLLLIHGTIDDNVHMQNTVQFAYELQQAGKLFDMMLYPKSRHGVSQPALRYHLQKTIFDFVQEQLLGK